MNDPTAVNCLKNAPVIQCDRSVFTFAQCHSNATPISYVPKPIGWDLNLSALPRQNDSTRPRDASNHGSPGERMAA